MNTPLKFDQRPNFQVEHPDYRTHYEDLAARTLWSIARRKGLIVSVVAFGLALACFIIPMMPRKYSAEALIYPNLFSREQVRRDQEKVVPLASVDAAAIVTSEARLIHSDAFLRAVAKRLGPVPEATNSRSWATQGLDWVRATLFPESRNESPLDRMISMLRHKVIVMNDTRSYLISISFTAPSPDDAAEVVNAFLIQYLHDKAIQRGLDRINSAGAELQQQLAIYGDKHPKALRAAEELDTARAALETALKPQEGDQSEITGDQSVSLAVPNQTPTSPRGSVILALSFLLALLAGIGLAIWLDRREANDKRSIGRQPHPQ
jgi:uncharacterized protein involved in exopolysaccharide biosynthesis